MKNRNSQKHLEKLFLMNELYVESVTADSLSKVNKEIDSLVEAVATETRKAGTNAKSRRELKEKQNKLFLAVLLLFDEEYEKIKWNIVSLAEKIAESQADFFISSIKETFPDVEAFKKINSLSKKEIYSSTSISINGWKFAEWITVQRNDFKNRYKRLINEAGQKGYRSDEVNSRILGSDKTTFSVNGSSVLAEMRSLSNSEYRVGIGAKAKRDLANLTRTYIKAVSSEILFLSMNKNRDFIRGIKHVSILDSRTTQLCRRYDGAVWTMDGDPIPYGSHKALPYLGEPPYHNNCRSVHVPITIAVSDDFDINGYGDISFDSWLRTLSEEEQIEILGKRFQSGWKNGDLKAEDWFRRRK